MAAAKQLFTNNANSTLAGSISPTDTTATLANGTGVLFPAPTGGDWFIMTFYDLATATVKEIVKVTARVDDVCTIVRGQESTAAASWGAGTIAALLPTAGALSNMAQTAQVQAQAPNYAVDSGAADAYVVALTPAMLAVQVGAPIRVKIANTNTGASTLSFGAGPLPIINPDGSALGGGTLVSGGVYEFVPDGAGNVQLISSNTGALSSLGLVPTGMMLFMPQAGGQAGYVVCNGTTIGNASSGASQLAGPSAQALFLYNWANESNTLCPVLPSGRGVSALADWNANKTMGTIPMQGRVPIGMDEAGSSALLNVPVTSGGRTTAGSVLGENFHALSTAELASHSHGITEPNAGTGHAHAPGSSASAFLTPAFGPNLLQLGGGMGSTSATAVAVTGITVNNAGSGSSHNTVQSGLTGRWFQKL